MSDTAGLEGEMVMGVNLCSADSFHDITGRAIETIVRAEQHIWHIFILANVTNSLREAKWQ